MEHFNEQDAIDISAMLNIHPNQGTTIGGHPELEACLRQQVDIDCKRGQDPTFKSGLIAINEQGENDVVIRRASRAGYEHFDGEAFVKNTEGVESGLYSRPIGTEARDSEAVINRNLKGHEVINLLLSMTAEGREEFLELCAICKQAGHGTFETTTKVVADKPKASAKLTASEKRAKAREKNLAVAAGKRNPLKQASKATATETASPDVAEIVKAVLAAMGK